MTDRGLLLWLDPHRTSLWHASRSSRPHRSCFGAVQLLGMAQQGKAWLPMVLWAVLGPCSAWLTPRISFPQGKWMVYVTVKSFLFLFWQYTVSHGWLYCIYIYIYIFYFYSLTTKNNCSKSRKRTRALSSQRISYCILFLKGCTRNTRNDLRNVRKLTLKQKKDIVHRFYE